MLLPKGAAEDAAAAEDGFALMIVSFFVSGKKEQRARKTRSYHAVTFKKNTWKHIVHL